MIESQIVIKLAQKFRGTFNIYDYFEGAEGLQAELPWVVRRMNPYHRILHEADGACLFMRISSTIKVIHRQICCIDRLS